MKRFTVLALASLSVALAASACGGRVIDEGLGGSGAGGSGAGGVASTSGVGASGPGTTGTTAGVGASPGTSTSTSTTSTSASSSSGGAPVQVFCNGGPCNPGEVCCFNPMGPGDHCGGAGQCDPGYAVLSCNGPDDCPGGVCCATQDNAHHYTGIACQATCGGAHEIVVCSKLQQDVCPAGTTCQHAQDLGNGYRVCVP